jgi:hypothetical protein
MFDLAISSSGDLIIAGNRDLIGIDGTNLIEQRMRLRCKIPRGSWVYDDNQRLGSSLHTILGSNPNRVLPQIAVFVNEALRGMEETQVLDVDLKQEGKQITAIVTYEPIVPPDEVKTTDEGFEKIQTEIVISP